MPALHTETVNYTIGDEAFEGYLACPDDGAAHPCVLVVQEWWGVNDYIRERVDMLAGLGYTAFAVDMYGAGKRATDAGEAGELMNAALGEEGAVPRRFNGALDLVRQRREVDAGKIAAIGYCFGGAVVLTMARGGADLAGVASFHGALATPQPAAPGAVKARILVCHGNEDAMIPAAQVEAFKQEMDAAGANYEFVGYDGALHGFTNPEADANGAKYELPLAYNQAADEDSWNRLQNFLARVFA
jgi:dienelactone hydrolase